MGNIHSSNTSSKSLRISNLTVVKNATSVSSENKEDVTFIWLDKTIDTSRTVLREITNYVLLYTELEPCITYIRSIDTERIFLVISGSYAEQCLNEIHDLPQIDSIFIFCINLNKYTKQFLHSEDFIKIIDVFDNEDRLIKSIRTEVNDLHRQFLTFSFYEKQKPTRDLSKESASFLWLQLFQDILLQIPRSDQVRKEMTEQYYHDNTGEVRLIDEFDQTYTNTDAIRWYTKQSFIYRLCNKALRTVDIELLYTLSYYIQDLCECLAIEHQSFRIQKEPIVKLYRGLKLTNDELRKFQSNISSLISTNGFLSTSRNYDLALEFALKICKRCPDVLPTLFIIEADACIDHLVFADVSPMSIYPHEEEVIFDIGCAFKINEVYFDDNKNIWIIKMNLTNEAKQIVQTYIEANKREMEKGNILLIFGLLLIEMGQYNQAQVYFEHLLSSDTVNDKASLYKNIGRVKYLRGLYDDALKDFIIVYEIQREESPENNIDLARTMNNMGLVYMEQGKYDLALDHLFDVTKIYEENSDIDNLLLANTDQSMGVIFSHKHDHNHAFKYLFRAMKLYEQHLPTIDHPLMATNYNSVGLVFYYTKEYNQSLLFCLKAFEIREKVLPINHPNIGDSCNNVALIHQKLCDYKQAMVLFERALFIYERNPDKKMSIPVCLNNIGLLYIDEKDYDQAIDYYMKSLNCYTQNEQEKYRDEIGYTLDNLGFAYEMKMDFEPALQFYKQSLEYQEENHNKFVQISMKIGNIYQKNCDYDIALDYCQKALNRCKTSPPDLLASLLMSIGIIYHRQHKYINALDYYKRTLSIRKEFASNYDLTLAWTYNNIGCLYNDIGDMNRALKYQQKAYKIRKISLLSNHPDLATSFTNLGRIYQAIAHRTNGDPLEYAQALENYKAAFHIRRKSLPIDHPDLALAYFNLALIHIDQQEYEQAYSEIRKALNIQRKKLPFNHPDLRQTFELEKQVQLLLDYHKK